MSDYEVTDSEDDYTKEDKLLLEDARKSMRKKEIYLDEEVYGFDQTDSNGDEDNEEMGEDEDEGNDMGSDIEGEEQLPDDRAWGKKKKSFYSADFVDQDYEGIYQGKEAEIAELEEEEAKNIQKHLIEQLNDADFSIAEAVDNSETSETKMDAIQADLSKLTKRQKLDLVKKESPEFFILIKDFKQKLMEAQKFLPVIDYFKKKVNKSFPALVFLQTKLTTALNYCTNISYYLFLKAKRIPIKNHPVLKSLYKYRQLLQQMEMVDKKFVQPQLDHILEMINSGKEVPLDYDAIESKKTLKVVSRSKQRKEKKRLAKERAEAELAEKEEAVNYGEEDKEMELPKMDENENKTQKKRAITYEMAKNKGLTPKRSKEQRNPRVKHRKKYEKAKIRRRGQVRTPRTEIPVYGGEPTGIKIGLSKSTKFKY